VAFLGIRIVMTPPAISRPRERGVTSNRRRSWTSSGVDTLTQLLTIEEILTKLLHSGNPNNKHNIMNIALVHLSIPETLLYRFHTLPEEIHVELLKPGTGDGVEVNILMQ
jgi:hypothetical protein